MDDGADGGAQQTQNRRRAIEGIEGILRYDQHDRIAALDAVVALDGHEGHIALDLGTLELIHYARKMPLDKIWRLRMRQEIKMPLFRGLLDWIRYHTGREIRSLKVIEQIMPSMGAGAATPQSSRGPRLEGTGCVEAIAGPDGFESVFPVKN